MTHARTIIRQAFVGLLKGKTMAGSKVYDSRLYYMEESSLPGIIVFSNNEGVITSTISYPRAQERTVKVTVECYAKATAAVNIIVDHMAAQVEELVSNDAGLKGLCKDCRLESTDFSLNSDGEKPVAVASLMFSVVYRTKEDRPDVII